MRNEAGVKQAVKVILKTRGVYYFMPSASIYGRTGIPDFVCCYRGRFIGIETKFGYNKQTANQKREEVEIVSASGVYLLIHENNIDNINNVLDAIDGKEGAK